MLEFFFDKSLGRDFWNFRLGQLVSLLGDSCSGIALAWWILEKTGSAAQMSSVMAPAMLVRIFLLPALGPFGDRFDRKRLILFSEIWRMVFTLAIAGMVHFDYYQLPLLIFLYILISAGSALFQAAGGGIIPQLVGKEKFQVAMQQSQAVQSMGNILGGVLGGVVVSFLGLFGAFLLDAFSYLIAGFCTLLIRANTKPVRAAGPKTGTVLGRWANELLDGFKILHRIQVLFWLCIVAMVMNIGLSPIGVVLPVLVKEGRNMPAWYLGAMESSVGLGAIIGAYSLGLPRRWLGAHRQLLLAIAMIGLGVALLPWIPTVALPVTILFSIGLGSTWANVIIGTQVALAVPDSYRSRISATMGFLCNGVSPLGVAGIGLLISSIGFNFSLLAMGAWTLLLLPGMLLIPHFKSFISASPKEAEDFFATHYPGALK